MARLKKHSWPASDSAGPRRERRGCDYETYLPDVLMGRAWAFDGDVAADLADAEAEIVRFNERTKSLSDTEGLARLLLRAEAVASSRIEGLEAGPRRILRAEAANFLGEASLDVGADEILGNIRAMQLGLGQFAGEGAITPAAILAIHEELLRGTTYGHLGGVIRDQQNWIGGNSYNPCAASFVPPPANQVAELLDDLCAFSSTDDLSPLAQAGIAHAQFEMIHPFADGSGRTGRVLIHLILKRRGIAPKFVPPISLVLATWSARYVAGLTATRYLGAADGRAAREGWNQWLGLFASATQRAIRDATGYEETIQELAEEWQARLGPVRSGSSVALLLGALPGMPVFTVRAVEKLLGRSFEAANQAVGRLEEAGIVRKTVVGRRNRAFEAPELIEAFAGLERRLASPEGNTRVSPPVRPVPRLKPRSK